MKRVSQKEERARRRKGSERGYRSSSSSKSSSSKSSSRRRRRGEQSKSKRKEKKEKRNRTWRSEHGGANPQVILVRNPELSSLSHIYTYIQHIHQHIKKEETEMRRQKEAAAH